jgi:hypothetical protein
MSRKARLWAVLRRYTPIVASKTYSASRWFVQQTSIKWKEIEELLPQTKGGRFMKIGLRLLVPTGLLLAVLTPIAGRIGLSLAFPAVMNGFGWIFFLYGFAIEIES